MKKCPNRAWNSDVVGAVRGAPSFSSVGHGHGHEHATVATVGGEGPTKAQGAGPGARGGEAWTESGLHSVRMRVHTAGRGRIARRDAGAPRVRACTPTRAPAVSRLLPRRELKTRDPTLTECPLSP